MFVECSWWGCFMPCCSGFITVYVASCLSQFLSVSGMKNCSFAWSWWHFCQIAWQRGDAEMSQKLWRVVRACVEMGPQNPIIQIHDQGAGGNCNVVKEIVYPLGAEIDIREITLGDQTMSVLEIWGAEYQENDCLLIKPESRNLLEGICGREMCGMQVGCLYK